MAVTLPWWEPPARVGELAPGPRMGFALACAEHIVPSFDLQAQEYPESVPPGLSPATVHSCLERLWAWLDREEGPLPQCIDEDVLDPETAVQGLAFLVEDACSVLVYAPRAYTDPEQCAIAGHIVLTTVDELVQGLLGPHPHSRDRQRDAQLRAQWEEDIAAHDLVRAERVAQAEAYEALARGAVPTDLRGPAQQMGQVMATWTTRLLEQYRKLPHPALPWLFPPWVD